MTGKAAFRGLMASLVAVFLCVAGVAPAMASDANEVHFRVLVADQISFGANQSSMTRNQTRIVDTLATWLSQNPDMQVVIEGHADGGERKADSISEARAESVRKYLVRRGVSADRLSINAHGASQPQVAGSDARSRAVNRRVEFSVMRVVSFRDEIRFKAGTAVPEAAVNFDDIASRLKNNEEVTLRIIGHAEATEGGESGVVEELSAARAQRVRQELVKRGVESSRLIAVGAGSQGRMAGRRVHFAVSFQ